MPRFQSIQVLALAIEFIAMPVMADEVANESGGREDTVAPVIISTATHTDSANLPRHVLVIDRKALQKSGAKTVAEALQRQPGVSISQTHRGSGAQIQGLDAKHVLVLIDGVRVFGKAGEEIDLSRLDLASVERIELVKGAASSTYGADGLAGVINIITRGASKDLQLEVTAEAGSLTSTQLSLSAGGRLGDWKLLGSVGGQHRDAYSLEVGQPGTTSSAYDILSTGLRVSGPLGKHGKLLVRGSYGYRFLKGLDAASLPKTWQGEERWRLTDNRRSTHSLQLLVRPELLLPNIGRFRWATSVSHYDELLRQDQRRSSVYDDRSRTVETGVTTKLVYDHAVGDHLIAAGLEGQFEWLTTNRLATGQAERQRLGVFVEDEWLVADLGSGDTVGLSIKAGLRLDVDSQFGASVAPSVALKFDPHAALTIRASFGVGLRAPGFKELYLSFENLSVGYVVDGNPILQPEHSRSLAASVTTRPFKEASLTLGYFRHDIQDLIVSVPTPASVGGPTVYSYANVASATSQGLEVGLKLRPWSFLSVNLDYAFTDARDDLTGKHLSGRTQHHGTTGVTVTHSGFSLTFNGRWVGETPYDIIGVSGTAPGEDTERFLLAHHVLADLQLSYDVSAHLRLRMGLTNLADAGHPDALPVPPRAFYAGMSGQY